MICNDNMGKNRYKSEVVFFTFTENCKLINFKVIITVFNEVLCKRTMLVIVQQGLSLYSTRTQNTWLRGLALGNAADARILRWGYQHVGI